MSPCTAKYSSYICFLLISLHLLPSAFAEASKTLTWSLFKVPPLMMVSGEGAENGMIDYLLTQLEREVVEYKHQRVLMPMNRVYQEMKRGEALCHPAMIKNPHREKVAYFTLPVLVIPGINILTKTGRFAGVEHREISLTELIRDTRYSLGITEGRSYERRLDTMLKAMMRDANILVQASSSNRALFKMLEAGRIDYMMILPMEASYRFGPSLDDGSYELFPVKESSPFLLAHIACTKSAWGAETVSVLNEAIKRVRGDRAYQKVIQSWLPSSLQEQIKKEFETRVLAAQ